MLEVEVIRTQKTSNKPNEMAARAWNDRTGETSNVWVIKIVPTTLLYRYMTHIQYITRVSRVHQDSLYREATIGCGPLKPPDFIHTRSTGLSSAQVSVLRHTGRPYTRTGGPRGTPCVRSKTVSKNETGLHGFPLDETGFQWCF